MFISDVKFVDLEHSEWDKEKSDPKKGVYVFAPGGKVYINYFDRTRQPEWFVSWSRYDPQNQFRDLIRDKYSKGYTEVNVNEDKWIWPEPLAPDENGWYRIPGGDAILMKRPLIEELKDRVAVKAQSDRAARAALDSWDSTVRRSGGIPVSQDHIEELLKEQR